MSPTPSSQGRHPMQCMEIWGGTRAVEGAVSTPGLDVWVHSRPYQGEAHGGDVYYVSLCGGGIITRLVVADVSGHGESVAEFSGSLRRLVRKNINRKSQSRLIAALNREFAAMARFRRFATAIVATYLANRDRLTLCNAGHPRPLWYRASTGSWGMLVAEVAEREASASNLPLGLDDATPYDQYSVRLGPGDLVVIYTDALIEASDAAGRMLGESGLLALTRGLDPREPIALGPALLDAVGRHRGGEPADDDATLLILYHNAGPTPHLSIAQKLDVYAKVFGLRPV